MFPIFTILKTALSIGGGIAEKVIERKEAVSARKAAKSERKHELKEAVIVAKNDLKISRINRKIAKDVTDAKALDTAAQTENISIVNLTKGYKDEFAMLIFLTPIFYMLVAFPTAAMVGIDTKTAEAAIKHGIEQLKELPTEYWYLIWIIVLKSLGVPVASLVAAMVRKWTNRKGPQSTGL